MEINSYPCIKSTAQPEAISFNDYLSLVKTNNCPYPKGSTHYDYFKTNKVRAVTLNGFFKKNPSYDNFIKSTGLMFVEIDGLDSTSIEEVKRQYFDSYTFIVAAYKSLSGTGLHFILSIDEHLQDCINNNNCFKDLLIEINKTYFENRLDANTFKITQYTIAGSDKNPLHRDNPTPLSFDFTVNETKPKIKKAVNVQPLILDFTNWENLSEFKRVELITNHYPAIKDRYYWFDYTADLDLAYILTAYNEILNPSYLNEFNLKTCISEQYFEAKSTWTYTTFSEPIATQEIITFIKTKEGNRRNRLLIESSKLLFNNPFLTFDKFTQTLFLLNNLLFTNRLEFYEVESIANYQYRNFINGKMTFPEPKMKSVFYSTLTVIEGDEKRKITKTETYKRKKEEKLNLIHRAIKDLNTSGTKVTQKSVSALAGIPLVTLQRLWKDIKKVSKSL